LSLYTAASPHCLIFSIFDICKARIWIYSNSFRDFLVCSFQFQLLHIEFLPHVLLGLHLAFQLPSLLYEVLVHFIRDSYSIIKCLNWMIKFLRLL
jgi:hypothetical protein